MKNINNKLENLSELVAAYEAILAHEGLAPIDGETFDAKFYEKKTKMMDTIHEEKKKANKELNDFFAELKCFNGNIKLEWALGLLSDETVHQMYEDFTQKPEAFVNEGLLSEEAKHYLSDGWEPAKCHPSFIKDWNTRD